jgi:hypothetical protein
VRLEATRQATPAETEHLLGVFTRASAEWTMIDIAAELVERAAAPFPEEPVRALDAIHLASALAQLPRFWERSAEISRGCASVE